MNPFRGWTCWSSSRVLAAAISIVALRGSAAIASRQSNWDPVPPEDLAQTDSRVEPGADAEALFVRTWVTDGWESDEFVQEREHYSRIKVFTVQGAQSYSKIDIDVPVGGARVDGIRARTIQPDGSITTLDKKEIANETIAKLRGTRLRRVSFAPPSVKPGCILEVRWHEFRQGPENLVLQMDFQSSIPAREISYYMKPLSISAPGWYVRQMRFHLSDVATAVVDGFDMTRVVNQRAYHEEPFDPPEYQQRAWLLQYYTQETITSPEIYWPKLGRQYWEWFDRYTKPDRDAQDLARQIAQGATTDLDRIERLARWIQHDFRVVRSADRDSLRAAGLKAASSVKDALRQRGGTTYDADVVFATLMRALGIDVRYVCVPSRRMYFFDRNMMSPEFVRSYQIAARWEGGWRSFDPSTRYLPWDMVPWDEEAQDALLCDRDSSRFVLTSFAGPERTVRSRTGSLDLGEDGTVEGDLSVEVSGHLNQDYRDAFEGVDAEALSGTLVKEEGWSTAGLEVSKVELLNPSDDRAPLRIRCHLRLPGHGTVTGKRILFEPAILASREDALLTAGTRHHPVYFRYAWSERDSIQIRIPEGWVLESAEPPQKVDAKGVAAYKASSRAGPSGREVIHQRSFQVGEEGSIYFPASSYSQLKKLFDLVHDHDRAAVTLRRADQQP